MSEQKLPIDVSFNFYSDSGGKDPDSYSPTLKKYHKLLWSKPLPSGKIFTLTDTDSSSYLTYSSAQNEISLSSDSISNSYRDKKALSSITSELSKEVEEFRNIGSTIGGYILFPGKKIDGKMTINGARGFNQKIAENDLAKLNQVLGGQDMSVRDGAEQLVKRVVEMCRLAGTPDRLSEFGLKRSRIPWIAKHSSGNSMKGNPVQLSLTELEQVIELAF